MKTRPPKKVGTLGYFTIAGLIGSFTVVRESDFPFDNSYLNLIPFWICVFFISKFCDWIIARINQSMMINSVLYILVSKFFATIYVNIFWRRFIKTEFAGLDPLHITGYDIQLQEEIGRKNILYNSIVYFCFYWFNRYYFCMFCITMFIGNVFLNIPWK